VRINWLAILVALIAQQVLGFLWYSEILLFEPWAAGTGLRSEELVLRAGPLIHATIAALLLPIGIAWVLHKTNLQGLKAGGLVGLGAGLLFIAPAVVVHESFLGYPPTVLAIDAGKEVVGAFLVGVILGGWRSPS
jgi:hypothetical protein